MPQIDPRQVIQDPKFLALPPQEKIKVLSRIDPNFVALPDAEKSRVVVALQAPRPKVPGIPAPPAVAEMMAPEQVNQLPLKLLSGAQKVMDVLVNTEPQAQTGFESTGHPGLDIARNIILSGVPGTPETAGMTLGQGLKASPAAQALSKVAPQRFKDFLDYRQQRPLLRMAPEGKLVTGLNLDMTPDEVIRAGSALKHGESLIGKPVKDVDSAKAAAQAAFKDLYRMRRQLIDTYKDAVVPGSGQAFARAKIAAIPDAVRVTEPAEYAKLMQEYTAQGSQDFTFGQIEKLNTDLNSINRTYHNAKLSGALTKEAQVRGASDLAAERVSRQLLTEAADRFSPGSANDLKNINAHIGSLIRVEDALDSVSKAARLEAAQTRLSRVTHKIGARATSLFNKNITSVDPVNKSIADAMRRWSSRMTTADYMTRIMTPPNRMIPAQTGGPFAVGEPPWAPQPGTGFPQGAFANSSTTFPTFGPSRQLPPARINLFPESSSNLRDELEFYLDAAGRPIRRVAPSSAPPQERGVPARRRYQPKKK